MLAPEMLWDRIAGCLHGLLIGNSLGSPVEGWTAAQIEAEFGTLDQMVEVRGRHWRPRGLHTDDGQQALAVLDAICTDPEHPEQRFAELMVELRDAAPQRSGRWGLHRGVSRDFRHTVRGMQATGLDKPFAHATPSAGNGAAMRIAPAALWWRDDARLLNQRVVQLSAVTHSDMRGIMGALTLATAISQALVIRSPGVLTQRLRDSVETAERQAAAQLGIPVDTRFSRLVGGLVEHRRTTYHLPEVLAGIEERARAIGEPNEQVEATSGFAACSVLLALAIVDFSSCFEEAVVTAINLGGETDTVGAMVGALAGARWGLSAVPSRWLDDLRATGSLLERIEMVVNNDTGVCRPDLLALELQWDTLYEDRPRA
ncbi:putative ADP-ribosylglycohydrolase [Enhygromyxa salina]|uniref:Putative ADP-ribosylglycohydrolase n=1 Tax=Enhygromyxa salina TaxID=215803 RepID=A0A0C1ZX65_9BACT|nr:ADP-ribosylglycohydrolase family protein [Enhygromyxa salina]KIG15663.1 putative ADP-ribosylglycohydrolase [Enhygromyxa salina]